MNRALSPMAMFMEMMMNQTMYLATPSVKRRSVTAKLVLDHIAAVIEKVPPTLMALNSWNTDGHNSGGNSIA